MPVARNISFCTVRAQGLALNLQELGKNYVGGIVRFANGIYEYCDPVDYDDQVAANTSTILPSGSAHRKKRQDVLPQWLIGVIISSSASLTLVNLLSISATSA